LSHYLTVKVNVTNDRFLKQALAKMGLQFEEGNFRITQYGKTENAEIKFENALGLQKQKDGTWMLVGDPYHCQNKKLRSYYGNQNFSKDLGIQYTLVETKEKLESMNFECVENSQGTVGKNGKIRMLYNYNS
jgi:hypothetical protein